MAKKNRTCAVCQNRYSFCPNCEKNYRDPQPSWKMMFDNENCYNIFEVLSAYSCNHITAETAVKRLEKCDISGKANFRDDSKRVLEKLYRETEKSKVTLNKKKD